MTELTGITWDHTRGYVPMAATAQRFTELHRDVAINWKKRSLQEFADSPIEKLALHYDLLVIDHPFSGYAADNDVLLPLDEYLPKEYLDDQAANSVGSSHRSYNFGGHQWALAIDAATPVSGMRPDLLDRAGCEPPETWSELLELAGRGLVAIPAIPIDSLMNFYMLCGGLGEDPFLNESVVVSEAVGVKALGMLRELVSLCDPACLERNPILTWDLLAGGDTAAVCPFAYGYSNYSRRGYSRHAIQSGGLVRLDDGPRLRSTLGGAGLAISSRTRYPKEAARYAEYVASGDCQRTLYFDAGGQPGHRAAWEDDEVNRISGGFFRDTLPTLDEAFLRPRFNGYLHFQDYAGPIVHRYLREGNKPKECLRKLDALLSEAKRLAKAE